ncbi:MAG: DUF3330 domain-containing protein [Pseudomonadota bacterium]|jgi:hypothetical protein
MAQQQTPQAGETVSCDVCLKEVPASEAKIAEAADYVAHFCGLECYAKWKRQTEGEQPPKSA